jgi:predicted DNA-binding transcriptional regulator AlpA
MLTKSALLTRDEVAAFFHVSPQTLMIWVSKGRFPPPIRIGHRALWNPATVERALVSYGLAGDQESSSEQDT